MPVWDLGRINGKTSKQKERDSLPVEDLVFNQAWRLRAHET